MYSHSLYSNRYKITKAALAVFLVVGILNWAFNPKINTYAEEGEGVVETPTATVEVVTGDAVASVDVVTEVNTNLTNSEGQIVVVNDSLGQESLDLSSVFASSTPNLLCSGCISTTTIENQNTATVTNEITVSASTGGNSASSTDEVSITTGDAIAAANVVNIANTNILDSKYVLVVFNNFGNWSGDLVLPKADLFADFLSVFNPDCDCAADTDISNDNTASVLNSVTVEANTGNNSLGEGSFVRTGDSVSSSNTYNLVNKNIYKDSSFYMMIKVFGGWDGNIFNLPEGVSWKMTSEGLALYDKNSNPFDNESSNTSSTTSSYIDITNNSSVEIENNVRVSATTGSNSATGTNAAINTGNAYAGANVVNIANTNIISSNWMSVLVNIFGDWNGNISFGQPNLWIGTVANVEGAVEAGSSVEFKTTVKNNGNAPASDINVLALLKSSHFKFAETLSDFYEHHIPKLNPGDSAEFTYRGSVESNLPTGSGQINIESIVSSFETDADLEDNIDRISFNTISNSIYGAIPILPYSSYSTSYPGLSVVKTHTILDSVVVDGVEMLASGGSVEYKIVVKNSGGSAFDGVLFDELRDENDKVINRQQWELGEIFPDEEIIVSYTTEFDADTLPGSYTNHAWVEATNGDNLSGLPNEANSNIAEDTISIRENPISIVEEGGVEEVLGASFAETESLSSELKEEKVMEFLGGFCFNPIETEQEPNKYGFTQTALLGFSFVLIVRKTRNSSINLVV